MSRPQSQSRSDAGHRAREEMILRWRDATNQHRDTLVDPHRSTPSVHDDPILPSQHSRRYHTHGDPQVLSRSEKPHYSSHSSRSSHRHNRGSKYSNTSNSHPLLDIARSHISQSPPNLNPPSMVLVPGPRGFDAEPRSPSSLHSASPPSAQSTSYIFGSCSTYIVRPRRHQAVVIPHANGGYIVVPPTRDVWKSGPHRRPHPHPWYPYLGVARAIAGMECEPNNTTFLPFMVV
ncbi:hypothetical protein BD779DRAFT_474341 [Infundibulicybe gibba]|nr:hypothetical protein BD779DRAFT_474341 [Infundibulicybe gibba]